MSSIWRACGIGILVAFGITIGSTTSATSVAPGRDLTVLSLSVSARDLAVGESTIAVSANPFGALFNPASLAGVSGTHVYSYHGRLSEEIDVFSATLAHQFGPLTTMGLTWSQYQTTGIPLTDVTVATPTQDIDTTDGAYSTHALTGGIATQLTPGLSVGVSVTGWTSRLTGGQTAGSKGFTLTPGVVMQLDPFLSIGLRYANALSHVAWTSGGTETLAPITSVGLGWVWQTVSIFSAIETDPNRLSDVAIRVGGSVRVLPFWTVSAGLVNDTVCVGTGFAVHRLRVDYAYSHAGASQLASGSRVTVGVVF